MENPAKYIEGQEILLKANLRLIYPDSGIQELVDEFTKNTGLPVYEITICFNEVSEIGKSDVKSIFTEMDVFRASA